jgi:hypothetical protein
LYFMSVFMKEERGERKEEIKGGKKREMREKD